ncbi:MAG: ABC transporter permease [Elusimicrobia bacterium]|nr:ABC transporter permease [Elusimicrobiota bacterium]
MNLADAARTGLVEIRAHKARSLLSLAAIAFGVAAILYTFAIANEALTKQREAFNLVGPGPIQITFMQWRKEDDKSLRLSRGLTSDDAESIRLALPWVHMVSPVLDTWGEVRYKFLNRWSGLLGVTDEWRKRNWVYTLRGRFFNKSDYETGAPVCVLIEPGGWAKGKSAEARRWSYYNDEDIDGLIVHYNLLNQEISVNNTVLTVVGILKDPPKDKDPRWFKSDRGNNRLLVPLTTAQRYFNNDNWRSDKPVAERVSFIDLDTGSLATVPAATRRLQSLLDILHRGEKDFQIVDLRQEIQKKVNEMREHALTILSLGLLAILAGGVGITNVTLATVYSRIREIGVRRAVGATRMDILMQFVVEAMLLGLLGGIAGVIIGLGGLLFVAEEGVEKLGYLVWWHYLFTVFISVGASFVFALYPAYSASRLDPTEALLYE